MANFHLLHDRVNVLQGVYLTKFSIDHLRESHGTILAVSSLAGTYHLYITKILINYHLRMVRDADGDTLLC